MAAMEQFSEWRVLAWRLRLPTVASEQHSSQKLGLADWPQSGNRYGRFGHAADAGFPVQPPFDMHNRRAAFETSGWLPAL